MKINWDHCKKPFTFLDPKGSVHKLTRNEKIKAIALSVLAGMLLPVVGGVVVFYLLTAKYKVDHLKNSPIEKQEKGGKQVKFKEVRQKVFDNKRAPVNVGEIPSDVRVLSSS